MAELASLFAAAAEALLDPPRLAHADPRVGGMLRSLECPLPAEPGPKEHDRARLFRAAADFVRVFRLESSVAPGLHCFGGEVDPAVLTPDPGLPVIGVVGTGLTPMDAFASCIGEGIERLSTIEAADDPPRYQPPPVAPAPWLLPMLDGTDGGGEWLPARRLDGSGETLVPADLCVRRAPARQAFRPPSPLSVGCAASDSPDGAVLRGLFELIERDAVALWWRGGCVGRPVALDDPAAREATAMLAALRQGADARRTWVLDIATDIGVPAIAAVSFAPDGGGFCFGTASRATRAAAARSALLELVQLELAIEVVEAKRRERGDAALNALDESHLRRFHGINAARCALVHPAGSPRDANSFAGNSDSATLQRVLHALGAQGYCPMTIDLTRPRFGVPVARVICPGLQLEPSTNAGERLQAAIAENGGGDCHHGDIALM